MLAAFEVRYLKYNSVQTQQSYLFIYLDLRSLTQPKSAVYTSNYLWYQLMLKSDTIVSLNQISINTFF